MYLFWKFLLMLIVCYVTLNIYIFFERRKYRHIKSVPVAISLKWFLGNLPDILLRVKRSPNKNFDMLLTEYHLENGLDVFLISMLHRHLVLCMDRVIISRLLADRVSFPKRSVFHKRFARCAGVRVFGEYGMLTDTGTDLWNAKRKAMDPAFHKSFLKNVMGGINRASNNLVRSLHTKIGDQAFDITENFKKTALEAISVCGFDWSDDMINRHGDDTINMINAVVEVVILTFTEQWTFNLPWKRRTEKEHLKSAVNPARALLSSHLQERMNNGNPEREDILSYMIRSNQCSDQLDIEDLVDDYLVFIGAGMETTATTMAMTIFYLTTNPEIYMTVQDEVDKVFGDRKELNFEDINRLAYLEMVIKECLRINGPVFGTGRQCKDSAATLNGIYFPKGTQFFVPTHAVHNDPRYWKNPGIFDPTRFSAKSIGQIKPFTYMPFSAGPRTCIGKNFAMLEMKIVISRIIHDFDVVNLSPDVKDIEILGRMTCRPLNGVNVKVYPRSDTN